MLASWISSVKLIQKLKWRAISPKFTVAGGGTKASEQPDQFSIKTFSSYKVLSTSDTRIIASYLFLRVVYLKGNQVWKFNQNIGDRLPCEEWFLQAGRYATKGEEPPPATVCFSIEHACPRDSYVKTSNVQVASLPLVAQETLGTYIQKQDGNENVIKTKGLI